MRPAKCGTMPPAWCVSIRRLGWRSKIPAKTSRAMKTAVSYGQPKAHHSS